jgi:hypothetical protein
MKRSGVDIGGTFTDVIDFDEETGKIEIEKTPSTPNNPAKGVINGLTKAGTDIADLDFFSHGSTVGTNALIERELPRIGLITTEGFRDVHEIRDSTKDDLWDAYEDVADPYVQRRDRLEVPERIDVNGEVVKPLDEALLLEMAAEHDLLVTLEENAVMGGVGGAINEFYAARDLQPRLLNLGIPDRWIDQGTPAELLVDCGLDEAAILQAIQERLG